MNTKTNNTMTETRLSSESTGVVSTGLVLDYEEQPSAFTMSRGAQVANENNGAVRLVNMLNAQIDEASARVNEIARRIACGVILQGALLNEVKRESPGTWGKHFGKGGDILMSQQRANQYIGCLGELWQRAVAAGVSDDFMAQVDAAVAAYRENPNVIPTLSVLDALEVENWVSVHGMMIALGVVRPAKIRKLPELPQPDAAEAATPALPGLDELCAQHWSTASKMLDSFHYFIREDAGNLNKQQRTELREHLKGLLAELDQLEATAPALM